MTMEIDKALTRSGVFNPADMSILRATFAKAHLPEDTPLDREMRAAALIRLFDSGVRCEEELLRALGFDMVSEPVRLPPE